MVFHLLILFYEFDRSLIMDGLLRVTIQFWKKHWTTASTEQRSLWNEKQRRGILHWLQISAWREFPGWTAGIGNPNPSELRRENLEFGEANVPRMCGVEHERGESCTDSELRREESSQVFGWALICAWVQGSCSRSGENTPGRNRWNNTQSSHRAENSPCSHYPDWKDLLKWILEKDIALVVGAIVAHRRKA